MNLGLAPGEDIDGFWRRVADVSADWLPDQGAAVRDAVLLLPFAQQLAPARRAFLARGGWLPVVVDDSHSLASALGPMPLASRRSSSAAMHRWTRLRPTALLAQQTWAQTLKRDDPRAYRLALARLVETAHAFARAASQRADPARPRCLVRYRRRHLGEDAIGGTERALVWVALEWAASDDRSLPPRTRCSATAPAPGSCCRPVAPTRWHRRCWRCGDVPSLLLNADLDLDAPGPPTADCRCRRSLVRRLRDPGPGQRRRRAAAPGRRPRARSR